MSQLALLYESDKKQNLQSLPIPEPVDGFVQVRVEAAAFNPLDYKIYDSGKFVQKVPTVLGGDAAGEVTKIGPDVTKFKVGDRVTFACTPNSPKGVGDGERGAFQQYALADARVTAKARCLFAVLSGLEVITTSSPAHFEYLKSLGATTVIDRSAPDVAAQILAAARGPVKYVVDAISLKPTQLLGVEVLQPKGKLVLVLGLDPSTKEAAAAKDVTMLGTVGPTGFYRSEPFWDSVEGYLKRQVIKPNRVTVLPGGLHAWEEGFDLHRQGKVSGAKIVIRPQETKSITSSL
ncbi:GroES-like protein [Mycena venus]|uniref:GroES-like protein n=1 Tax=Mycena venus TaxID=2733690 RepID=A0A8H6XCG6_9AGAR|nr:GroES-like protein [Mycena venus]